MNFDRVTDLTVHGRFRIPFPDTSYASRERRDAMSVNGAGITNPGENTTPPVDRRSLRCFVTAHVVASIENLCASELAAHTNSAAESVVGSEVLLKHNHPAAVGSMVAVTARVTTIADASVTFAVEAKVGDLMIADGQLRFVIVARDRFAARPIQSVIERALAGDFRISAANDVRSREAGERVDSKRADNERADNERAAGRSALPVFSAAI